MSRKRGRPKGSKTDFLVPRTRPWVPDTGSRVCVRRRGGGTVLSPYGLASFLVQLDDGVLLYAGLSDLSPSVESI